MPAAWIGMACFNFPRHLPRRPRWLSLVTLLYGLLVFIWLTPEDDSLWPVVTLGVALSTLVGFHLVFRLAGRELAPWQWRAGLVAFGALIGAGAAPATVFLMFLKTALHSHLYPDYPPLLMLYTLERLPAWALAGGLAGLALALVARWRD